MCQASSPPSAKICLDVPFGNRISFEPSGLCRSNLRVKPNDVSYILIYAPFPAAPLKWNCSSQTLPLGAQSRGRSRSLEEISRLVQRQKHETGGWRRDDDSNRWSSVQSVQPLSIPSFWPAENHHSVFQRSLVIAGRPILHSFDWAKTSNVNTLGHEEATVVVLASLAGRSIGDVFLQSVQLLRSWEPLLWNSY